jgi:hypothetical protein
MLRYNVKLNGSEIGLKKIEWNDKYVSKDLSYISGTTPTSCNLNDGDEVLIYSRYSNLEKKLTANTETVSRDGYCVIVGKRYKILDGVSYYKDNTNLNKLNQNKFKYIEIDGRYFYGIKIDEETNTYLFKIDDFLAFDENSNIVSKSVTVTASTGDGNTLSIDKIEWIYDGKVTIDGHEYIVDDTEEIYEPSEVRNGGLVESIRDNQIPSDDITDCMRIDVFLYNHDVGYEYKKKDDNDNPVVVQEGHGRCFVTRFWIESIAPKALIARGIKKIGYVPYVSYRGVDCKVVYKSVDGVFGLYCVVPNHLIEGRINISYDDEGRIKASLKEYDYPCYFNDDALSQDDWPSGMRISGETEIECPSVDLLKSSFVFTMINDTMYEVWFKEVEGVNSTHLAINMDGMNPFSEGDIITLGVNNDETAPVQLRIFPTTGEHGEYDHTAEIIEWCVSIDGKKYDVIPHASDKVIIPGDGGNTSEYLVTYPYGMTNGKTCIAYINGVETPMKLIINGTSLSAETLAYTGVIKGENNTYSSAKMTYEIRKQDGVDINGTIYEVQESIIPGPGEGAELQSLYYANYYGPLKYHLLVKEVKGSNLVICEPVLSNEFGWNEAIRVKQSIISEISSNEQRVVVLREPRPFGMDEITPKSGFGAYSDGNEFPTSSSHSYDLFTDLTIAVKNSYITLPMAFDFKTTPNANQADLVQSKFVDYESSRLINGIVDMEKDVYYPKYIPKKQGYVGSTTKFEDINEIQINLHFRTRNQETWKVNEEYNGAPAKLSNWFITDWDTYAKKSETFGEDASDLVGLMGFSNYDVYYQKSRISRSFLRMSYYDSIDQQKQSLLYTCTVFMDGQRLYKKYIDNMRNGTFLSIKEGEGDEIISSTTSTVMCESAATNDNTNSLDYVYNEESRLDSRLIIKNKYASKSSSEGFYLYMFKEYSEKLHPKPIYLKLEFNHAGVGQTLPFIVPMKWGPEDSNIVNPTGRLGLTDKDDLELLKQGYPLKFLYPQLYIPLYAVYDFQSKQYAYVFDDRYVDIKNGVLTLNLYELKVNDIGNPLSGKKGQINRSKQFPLEES